MTRSGPQVPGAEPDSPEGPDVIGNLRRHVDHWRARSQGLERLLDHFDRYASIEDGTPYAGSPFEAEVKAALSLGLPDEEGEERDACDSCGRQEPLVFSPPHNAHFCPACLGRELGMGYGAAPPPRGAVHQSSDVDALRERVEALETALDGYALPALDDAIRAMDATWEWSPERLAELRQAWGRATAILAGVR